MLRFPLLLVAPVFGHRVSVDRAAELSVDAIDHASNDTVAAELLGAKKVVGGEHLELTWSDEFNEKSRDFSFGKDDNWEGIDLWYKGTWDDEVYKPGEAKVGNGKLRISLQDTPGWDRQNRRMHKFTSAMLQTWNKVCFTGGYFEVRLKLPGNIKQGGVWGAAWAAGNLGRPGYMKSTAKKWPYSYNKCDAGVKSQRGLDTGTNLDGQEINACDAKPGHGMNPQQGRGMPEIDLIESFVPTWGNDKYTRAHITTSLQMGPIIPIDVNHGPGLTGCQGDPRDVRIYEDCPGFTYFHNHTEKVEPNKWCQAVEGNMRGNTVQDCLSSEVDLRATHFEDYHTYGFLWEPKKRMVWYLDDEPLFEVTQEALSPKQSPRNPDFFVGQRDVPTEPMSLLLNVAMSDHGVMNWNRHIKFPVAMDVDYVRIYQNKANGHTLGCSPPSHPTATYIADFPSLFGLPVCGNGMCDDGECESCPSDCSSNMACPGGPLDEVPITWSQNRFIWNKGPRHGVNAEDGCKVESSSSGVRVVASGHGCTIRRTGLLPAGQLELTRRKKFAIVIDTSGSGQFHYKVTIGPGGKKCDPKKRGCPATYIRTAERDVALCAQCEGYFDAGGLVGQDLDIDLTHRFPYFVGAWGGELRFVVQPGADITFKTVKFGPMSVPSRAKKPTELLLTGYWEPPPCAKKVGGDSSCGDRMLWLMSPEGGSKPYGAAYDKVAGQFKECVDCTLPHDPCSRPVCEWAGQTNCASCADRMLWLTHKDRRWKRLRTEEAQEYIAQQWPKLCNECKNPQHPCDKEVCDDGHCRSCARAMSEEMKHNVWLSRKDAHDKVAVRHAVCDKCYIQ